MDRKLLDSRERHLKTLRSRWARGPTPSMVSSLPVSLVMAEHGLGERYACKLLEVDRGTAQPTDPKAVAVFAQLH